MVDARLWHPWLRINCVLRAMLHERWSAEAWPRVKAEFKKTLALRSQIRRAGWFNCLTDRHRRAGSSAQLRLRQVSESARMGVIRWRVLGVTLTRGAFPAWLVVGGVAWAYVIGWSVSWIVSTDAAATVRYAGTLLQIFGVVNVAIGLRETRKLFPGRSSIGGRVRGWFKQVASAFHPPQPITLQAQAAGSAAATGRARVRRGVGPNASADERLNVLEGNLNALQEEVGAELRDLTAEIGRVRTDLDRERNDRRKADDTAIRLIEEATIGGLNLECVGLLWLILGVLGAGFADEVARLLR